MATLSDIRVPIMRALRDTTNATFSVAEVDDYINQGIDALADIYPREIAQDIGTVAASVYTYDVSDFMSIFRVDLHTAAGEYRGDVPIGIGDGRNSGWETHAGILYTPPSYTLPTGYVLRAFGYTRYTQLSASTQTTDLDTSGINAVRVFVQMVAYQSLLNDRAKYQQWQTESNNTDVGLVQVDRAFSSAQSLWRSEQRRLRRLRKRG